MWDAQRKPGADVHTLCVAKKTAEGTAIPPQAGPPLPRILASRRTPHRTKDSPSGLSKPDSPRGTPLTNPLLTPGHNQPLRICGACSLRTRAYTHVSHTPLLGSSSPMLASPTPEGTADEAAKFVMGQVPRLSLENSRVARKMLKKAALFGSVFSRKMLSKVNSPPTHRKVLPRTPSVRVAKFRRFGSPSCPGHAPHKPRTTSHV